MSRLVEKVFFLKNKVISLLSDSSCSNDKSFHEEVVAVLPCIFHHIIERQIKIP
jgi:hypothetical protein